MHWESASYALPLILSAVISAGVAAAAWRQRKTPGAGPLALLMTAVCGWALGYSLELSAASLSTKVFWAKVEYIGIVVVPLAWLSLALEYTGRAQLLTRRTLGMLAVVPLITLLLTWTNGTHRLIWRELGLASIGPLSVLDVAHGPWFWVNVAYSYLLLAAGTGLLVLMVARSPRLYRQQSEALLLGVLIPWAANAAYLLGLGPAPEVDLTPFAFPLAGALIAWDLYRFRLLDVVPAMRDASVDGGEIAAAHAVMLLDRRWRIIDLNPAAQAILARPASQVIGRTLEQVSPILAGQLESAQPPYDSHLEITLGEEPTPRDYELALSALGEQHEQPSGYLLVLRDSTERRRVERQLRFLASAGESLAGSLDYDQTLTHVARLAVPFLADLCVVDVVSDAAIRPVVVAHVDPAVEQRARAMRQRFPIDPSGSALVAEVLRSRNALFLPVVADSMLERIAQDGEHLEMLRQLRYQSVIVVPLIGREQTLGTILLASTTPGRHYRPADLLLAEGLARHVALAVENARLYRDAQDATRAREEFLSIASHELKTPLTAIKAASQLLHRQIGQPGVESARLSRLAEQVHGQVQRLETLVADLLDVSRIQQGRLDLRPEPVDLSCLAQHVLARFDDAPERTERHRLRLDAPAPVNGHWDLARLDQMLTNLVSNALKYSPDGGEVLVRIRQFGDVADVLVRDQGLGIPAEEQGQLFQPFVRGSAARQRAGGTGLGLYITARIVEGHGGSIDVASAPDQGSAFHVCLPLNMLKADELSS